MKVLVIAMLAMKVWVKVLNGTDDADDGTNVADNGINGADVGMCCLFGSYFKGNFKAFWGYF